ncbi:MAG: GyrI-like domain-containing protein [Bdellovibrionales bacterium]|nr:GyrI-like domain-containing protein [Bdellovibrionales bacterium]
MIKWVGFIVIGGLLSLVTYLYIYLGAYKDVTVRVETYPKLYLIAQTHIGPYHKIGSVLQSMEKQAKQLGLDCSRTFGKFLDAPQTTDEDRLRSLVGCALDTEPDAAVVEKMKAELKEQPSARYVYGKFQGSPAIGPFVVYPKLKEEAANQRLALGTWALELYYLSRTGEIATEYLLPVSN